MKRLCIAAMACLALVAWAGPGRAAEFYEGKKIIVALGFTPGGGNDLYARFLAQHIGRHIPGNPAVIVQHMPGAGGLTATNWLYSVAPKDGTVLACADQSLPLQQAAMHLHTARLASLRQETQMPPTLLGERTATSRYELLTGAQ